MKFNKDWHQENPMPKNPTEEERIQWHVNHHRECNCRPIPKDLVIKMSHRKPKVVVGVLTQNKNKYLLVRERMESGRDRWIVPGGKVEFGESLLEAAKRELAEETGVKAKSLKFLCYKEAIFPDYNYHTVIFFYSTKTNQKDISDDIEGKVQEANWFTKSEILKLPLVESAEWLFDWLFNQK